MPRTVRPVENIEEEDLSPFDPAEEDARLAKIEPPAPRARRPSTGRPLGSDEFQEIYVQQAYQAAKYGMDYIALGKLFGVSDRTILTWTKRYPDFWDAIRRGKYDRNAPVVEDALLTRACGYEWDEVTEEAIVIRQEGKEKMFIEREEGPRDDKGRKNMVLVEGVRRRVTHKRMPPSDISIMFWLQNRVPELWKNATKQIIENSGLVLHQHQHQHDLSKLGRKDLERLRSIMDKAKLRKRLPQHGGSGLGAGEAESPSLHTGDVADGGD